MAPDQAIPGIDAHGWTEKEGLIRHGVLDCFAGLAMTNNNNYPPAHSDSELQAAFPVRTDIEPSFRLARFAPRAATACALLGDRPRGAPGHASGPARARAGDRRRTADDGERAGRRRPAVPRR